MMDERPDQRPDALPDAQPDEAAIFSIRLGSDQPEQAQRPITEPSADAPPPLTPAPPQPPYTPNLPPAGYMPASPQSPAYPAAPGNPVQPVMPSYPSQPQTPNSLRVQTQLPERKRGALGRPFPLSLTLLVVVGSVALLALVFAVRVLALGGDWAEGAAVVGVVALALAAVTLLVALVRIAAGRRSLGFALLSLALLVAFASTGLAGLASNAPLHLAQAQAMETRGQWSEAIHEYGLTGQRGPNAPDIARVQDAWGEQLLQQQRYQDALAHFQTVLDDYQQSGAATPRAQKGQFLVYAAWLKNDPNHVPYADAITSLTNYASNADCASDCKAMLAQATPHAYFLYGVQLLTAKRYALAIAEFGKLAAHYRSSPYAAQAHTKAAAAYLAYGQQQISNQDCSGAVTSYKTLVADYKGTPEASTAQNALNAPQDVTGVITNAPANPLPTVHLSAQMNFSAFYFSDEYSTSIDSRTGVFTFKQVAQGIYFLSTSRPVAGGIDYVAWWADSSHTSYFSFIVAPLCPVQLVPFSMS